jgi:structure-specific recognition protein 1
LAKQNEIKKELGKTAPVASISRRSAELWKALTPDQRAHWDEVALKDKPRYLIEKATYTGPWKVPWKRAKKDPSAPKRAPSAFLYFAQGRRTRIKKENPEMKNTEISRILGDMWKNLTHEERRPYHDMEKADREKYKVAVAEWKEECEAKEKADRKAHAEQQMLLHGDPTMQQPPVLMYPDPYGQPPYMYSSVYPYRTFN